MKKLPGIFNDVIGPVMRGPSSSHTAASWRIARTALDMLNEVLEKALVEFDRDGAWAPNFREQGTCMGMNAGLLGLEITDERMKNTEAYAREKGITIEYQISSFPTTHANTARLTLWSTSKKKMQVIAISLGGGSFEIISLDGFPVQLYGDLYVTMIFTKSNTDLSTELKTLIPSYSDFSMKEKENIVMYTFKSPSPLTAEQVAQLNMYKALDKRIQLKPIMPVIAGRETELPFNSIQSLSEYAEKNGFDLGDLGLLYEKCISGHSDKELKDKMNDIIKIIHKSINTGLRGTHYKDRILHQQSHFILQAEKRGKIRDSVINRIIENVSALMESKSAMEVIVALPTAGSCGTVGGSLRAVSENIGSTAKELTKAYFAAGIVGAYFAQGPGFSAEEHACQVECGAASGMAAAGIVQLMGGTAKQALDAASMAIQNMIGLVCDPVADRVEVPCLGKNVSAAVNAYASAIMSVSGFDAVIPLEEVIQTVSKVSETMPDCLKCTGKGGLAITTTALNLKKKQNSRPHQR